MPLFKRYEGDPVKDQSPELGIMPFLMLSRNESLVYFDQSIDFGPLRTYLAQINAKRMQESDPKIGVFHVVLTAMVRSMGLRPKMNRFVVGNILYQRKWIDVSFVVKKEFHDDSAASIIKVRFDQDDTLADVVNRINQGVERGRSNKHSSSEAEIALALKLPRLVLRLGLRLLKMLDYLNLMPKFMIDSDELYTSMVVANLGSLGISAPFHHLYEWGTAPIFCAIGETCSVPVVNHQGQFEAREILPFRWTFDERIIDGFYSARSLEIFKHFLLNPALLETKPNGVPDLTPDQKR